MKAPTPGSTGHSEMKLVKFFCFEMPKLGMQYIYIIYITRMARKKAEDFFGKGGPRHRFEME